MYIISKYFNATVVSIFCGYLEVLGDVHRPFLCPQILWHHNYAENHNKTIQNV